MNVKHPLHTTFNQRSSQPRTAMLIGLVFTMFLSTALAACARQDIGEAAARTAVDTDGAALFQSLKCVQCHETDGRGTGPSLVGLFGQAILLENGETVTADEQYIRTSILDPERSIHAGYRPMMPSYRDRIDEEELAMLVEYIRSLNGGN